MPKTIDLGDLLADAAPLTEGLGELLQLREGGFALAFADGTEMRVAEDPRDGRAVLSVAIGRPPLVGRSGRLAAMLAYNALWRETGGAWIALDGLDGPAMLMAELDRGAGPGAVARLLTNMAAVAAGWRDFLAGGQGATPPPALATPMMRV